MSLDHRGEDSSFELLVSDLRRHAVGTQAINVDFLEYCNFCNLFQAAIETTVNRKKPFTIVRNLAKAANCHGYVMILNNWGRGECDPGNYDPEFTIKTVHIPGERLEDVLIDHYSGREEFLNFFHKIHRVYHRPGCLEEPGFNDKDKCKRSCCAGRLSPFAF